MNDLVQNAAREVEMCKGHRLEYFTLGWNLTEAVVGIGAGIVAWQHPRLSGQEWNVQVQIIPILPKLIKGTLFH